MEMKFSGQFEVSPPPEKAFDLLSDPQKFAPLLPTFDSLEMTPTPPSSRFPSASARFAAPRPPR